MPSHSKKNNILKNPKLMSKIIKKLANELNASKLLINLKPHKITNNYMPSRRTSKKKRRSKSKYIRPSWLKKNAHVTYSKASKSAINAEIIYISPPLPADNNKNIGVVLKLENDDIVTKYIKPRKTNKSSNNLISFN
jgi:uncharacterized Zn finger protein